LERQLDTFRSGREGPNQTVRAVVCHLSGQGVKPDASAARFAGFPERDFLAVGAFVVR
jgi:hypothetical protein